MAKRNQAKDDTQIAGVQAEPAVEEKAAAEAQGTAEEKPLQLRYAGKTIKHFEYDGKMYQLMPNSVYLNLPAEAEQVKRLIENKELVSIV